MKNLINNIFFTNISCINYINKLFYKTLFLSKVNVPLNVICKDANTILLG
jgi:hypothetical protein